MNPGLLDRKIKLLKPTAAHNPLGDPTPSWHTYANPWARRLHRSGRTAELAGKDTPLRTSIYRIRFRQDVRTNHKLQDQHNTYTIEDIAPVGRNQYLDLTCTTTNAQ